jgi:uncharacterized protein (TIGR02300 family)
VRAAKGWPRFFIRFKEALVAKPELGTKRICPVTGRKFYDLNQTPVISPYTGEIVPIDAPTTRSRAEPARAAVAEAEVADAQGPEFVSLEEADAEATGAKGVVPEGDDADDVELAEDIEGGEEDDTFLEPAEDEDDDVSDIIGSDIEDEEET